MVVYAILILPTHGNLTCNTEAYIEGFTFEVLLDHRNLLNHRLFTRVFINTDTDVVVVVVVHIDSARLGTFPTIILPQALENLLPYILSDVRVEEGTIVFAETNLDFNVALILVSFKDGEYFLGKVHFAFLIFLHLRHSLKPFLCTKCNEGT